MMPNNEAEIIEAAALDVLRIPWVWDVSLEQASEIVRVVLAAGPIESLQARVAELESALEEIRDLHGYYSRSIPEDIAERALDGGVA